MMKERAVGMPSLRPDEALLFLLDGGELITSSNRIVRMRVKNSGFLELSIYDQTKGETMLGELDDINRKFLFPIAKFDFRKEMLARPGEWVGKKDIDGTEYYFGFNTLYMRVVGTSDEEAKKRKIDLGNNNLFYLHDLEGMEEI